MPILFRRYLYDLKYPHHAGAHVAVSACPQYEGNITTKASASISFFTPSDSTGISGHRKEQIRATVSFQGFPRYDTVLVRTAVRANVQPGLHGLLVAHLVLLFNFPFESKDCPTAVVRWFTFDGESLDEDSGMCIIKPQNHPDGKPSFGLIPVEAIVRACHLIPVYGKVAVPPRVKFHNSLHLFKSYYLNKFIDHHSFEILS